MGGRDIFGKVWSMGGRDILGKVWSMGGRNIAEVESLWEEQPRVIYKLLKVAKPINFF